MMQDFYEGIAEIFEVDVAQITPQFSLVSQDSAWDSLAIISTIALVDDCFNVMLDGKSLGACESVEDIQNLIKKAG